MIDSHSHIYTDRYKDDREQVIDRAATAGISRLLQVGCNLAESREALALAERVTGIYASVGVHPHDAIEVNESVLDALTELCRHPKVLSWGEIGLDFYYDNSPRDIQIAAFSAQMKRAAALQMPVVIHTRDAERETLAVLRETRAPMGGHVHCFTGTKEMAQALLDLGFHIGFTGIITFKNAAELRDVVEMVPMERLLIETDSPYLSPIPHRGKRNEPAFVQYVAEKVGEIKGLTPKEVMRITDENFAAVYGREDMTWETLNGYVSRF